MQLVSCDLQMNNFKGEHTGNAVMKIRGTVSDRDILTHFLQTKIGCDTKLKKNKVKKQNMGELSTPVPYAGMKNERLFQDNMKPVDKAIRMQKSN